MRTCIAPGCGKTFECIITSSQKFCSKSCVVKTKRPGDWRLGLTKEIDSRVAKIAEDVKRALTGRTKEVDPRVAAMGRKVSKTLTAQYAAGRVPGMQDKHQTEDAKKRIGQSNKGNIPWSAGLTVEDPRVLRAIEAMQKANTGRHPSEETIEKIRKKNTNFVKSEDTRKKDQKAALKRWQDPPYIAAQIKARHSHPNEPEKFLTEWFDKIFPGQIKYTGSGGNPDFIIGRRNPDFMFVDGQKKIIEFNGDFYHGLERTGRTNEEEEQRQISHYAKYGYQTLVIWERELKNINKLYAGLLAFSGEGKYEN